MNYPIITSLMDLDCYKLYMAQLAFLKHRDVIAMFRSNNRTKKFRLATIIPKEALMEQLRHVTTLRLTTLERIHLEKQGIFRKEFLDFLQNLSLKMPTVTVVDGQYVIEVEGIWCEITWWETLWLSILNELFYHFLIGDTAAGEKEGIVRLMAKIPRLKKLSSGFSWMEFGTRRRFSREWQQKVLEILIENKVPFTGTSNVRLAMLLELAMRGTQAHEMDMVYSGIYRMLDDLSGRFVSHDMMLDDWYEIYGLLLSIALSDTYGSEYFFRTFGEERARLWKGMRQDSGDVFGFGERQIGYYESFRIDPLSKLFVPSDGLDIDLIEKIDHQFSGRIQVSGGWGTTLTNDLGYPTLSNVAKAVEANGFSLVKLSDNLAKGTGPDADQERAKRLAGYTNIASKECIV